MKKTLITLLTTSIFLPIVVYAGNVALPPTQPQPITTIVIDASKKPEWNCVQHEWLCDEWGPCQKDAHQYRNCTLIFKCPDPTLQTEIPPGGTSQMCKYSEKVGTQASLPTQIISVAPVVGLNIASTPICTSTIWKRLPCENGEAVEIEIPQSPVGCKLHQSAPRIVKCNSIQESIAEKVEKSERENQSNVEPNQSAVKLKGLILLQVESRGEAYYVNPDNAKRYYLGRPADAFQIMRELGLGASHDFVAKYKNRSYPDHVVGKILIDVGDHGKAYYVYPKNKKAYYLGRPADAFKVMRELGLGISNNDLEKIAEN